MHHAHLGLVQDVFEFEHTLRQGYATRGPGHKWPGS